MIGLPDMVAAVMLASLIAYALLGGADFGGGVWDLLASGPRADRQRSTIARAIGPIWEANHVWLIAVVVLLFGAFAPAFAQIVTRLHIPVTLLLLGIVLRGSSFVFRTYDTQDGRVQHSWGLVFAVSSLVTPVLLGIIIGAISMPAPLEVGPASFRSTYVDPWLRPFPIAVGLFALAQFAFLAAVYLTLETDDPELQDDFRRRALGSALVLAALGAGVLVLPGSLARSLAVEHLHRWWSAPLLLTTGGFAVASFVLLWRRRYVVARVCAAAQVSLILLGWGLAQHPYLIADSLTIDAAAAPPAVLRWLLIAFACGSVILLPALWYLLRTFKGSVLFGSTPD